MMQHGFKRFHCGALNDVHEDLPLSFVLSRARANRVVTELTLTVSFEFSGTFAVKPRGR